MIRSLLLASAFVPALLVAQAPEGTSYASLTGHLEAIGTGNDAARDSASVQLKHELGLILDSDSAFTATFADVPLSHVDAPDGVFRLFTWNVRQSSGNFLYEGFLLVKKGNKHILYELRDMTDQIAKPATAQLGPEEWYGAIYYEVLPVKRGIKTYYTLLGWKGYNRVETRKVIDVLSFNGSKPKFGAPVFGSGAQRNQREVYAYTAQGSMQLKWMPARKAIIMDHLSPTRPEFAGHPAFMAPDFSFDSYTWDKNHWRLDRDIDLRQTGKSKPYKAPPKEAK